MIKLRSAMRHVLAAASLAATGCDADSTPRDVAAQEAPVPASRDAERAEMVKYQIVRRGVRDPRVLAAMREVPRHAFVPDEHDRLAYDDTPLPIGFEQTISQPFIVAYMTEALEVEPEHRVLEIGTGSGYQAAVLGEIARRVYTIEIVPELAARATRTLGELGYENVAVREGDGYAGWPEHAPFDRIMVTAAPDHVPQPLVDQLAVGGRLVIPVGDRRQQMTILTKTPEGVVTRKTLDVRFVPLTRRPGG